MESDNFIESKGTRPFWKTILASVFFTVMFVCIYFAVKFMLNSEGTANLNYVVMFVFFGFWCGSFGWYHAAIIDYTIDIDKKRYHVREHVGPFRKSGWKDLKNIKSLSLTKTKEGDYDVKLGRSVRKNIVITKFGDYDEALDFATRAAESFQLKLKNKVKES